jgi:SnoaL-like domain
VSPDDRAEIVDALYRFGAGQDLRDRALFDSAFAADATLDFTGPARRLGAAIPIFEGRQAIGDTIFATIHGLDTTHSVTNPRVTRYDGTCAELVALVEAQHLRRNDHSRRLLLKNFYFAELVRNGAGWVIDRLRIENVWMDGDPSVLFAGRDREAEAVTAS